MITATGKITLNLLWYHHWTVWTRRTVMIFIFLCALLLRAVRKTKIISF